MKDHEAAWKKWSGLLARHTNLGDVDRRHDALARIISETVDDNDVIEYLALSAIRAQSLPDDESGSTAETLFTWLITLSWRAWVRPLPPLAALGFAHIAALRPAALRVVDEESDPRLDRDFVEALAFLTKRREAHAAEPRIYTWLTKRGASLDPELHLEYLSHESKLARDAAASRFGELGEAGLEAALAQLGSTKAALRATAAIALQHLRSPEALEALEKARAAERAKKSVLPEIERAIALCQPREAVLAAGEGGEAGLNQAIVALRALFGEEVTHADWGRICDLVDGCLSEGDVNVAVDYLRHHGVDTWPAEVRVRPFGWSRVPALAALAPTVDVNAAWATLTTLRRDGGEAFVDAHLPGVEKRSRTRLLDRSHIPALLDWIEKACTWADANEVPRSVLQIRIDGGSLRGDSFGGETTLMEMIYEGYGVRLARDKVVFTSRIEGPGLRYARALLPRSHPLRERKDIGKRKKYIHLNKFIKTSSSDGAG